MSVLCPRYSVDRLAPCLFGSVTIKVAPPFLCTELVHVMIPYFLLRNRLSRAGANACVSNKMNRSMWRFVRQFYSYRMGRNENVTSDVGVS